MSGILKSKWTEEELLAWGQQFLGTLIYRGSGDVPFEGVCVRIAVGANLHGVWCYTAEGRSMYKKRSYTYKVLQE